VEGELGLTLASSRTMLKPFFQRIWQPAILVLGLALTGAWMAILGYWLMWLVGSTLWSPR
jgi:hypothetical protein